MAIDTIERRLSVEEDGDRAYEDVIRSVQDDDDLEWQNPGAELSEIQNDSESGAVAECEMGLAFEDALTQLKLTALGRLATFREVTLGEAVRRASQTKRARDDELERSQVQVELLKERAAALQSEFEHAVAIDERRMIVMERMATVMRSNRIMIERFRCWRQWSSKRQAMAAIETGVIRPKRRQNRRRACFRLWVGALVKKQKAKREELFKSQIDIVSRKLIETYEQSLHNMRKKLAEAERQIGILVQSKHKVERDMRQAFLRSVSTLNLEAMSMFNAELCEKKVNIVSSPGESESSRRSIAVRVPKLMIPTTPKLVDGDVDLSWPSSAISEQSNAFTQNKEP